MSGKTVFGPTCSYWRQESALICFHTRVNILEWLIIFVGVMFAIPGLIGVISGISRSGKGNGVNASSMYHR